ncbi:uncharacterized protein RAG0_07110 [Rhynchosporium agropyri]|uniref:AB hydrolase-1 domain-containing protein n=1 Tax=Rhynchosporium agropyri TaxID=914238 RepID=A0A1E1KJW6_9HELO|nr:uncharacterized protein RAG0_07110 [Rhynchosporium agropyri]
MPVIQVSIDGGSLAVEVDGQSDAPLIVCSPGMGDTRDAFGPLSAKLVAAGYRVARVDLRGHGESTLGFNNYGDEAIADDYVAIIGALGGGSAILAGASCSAGAGAIAAAKNPESVAGLILLGPFLRNGGSALMLYILRIALWWPWGPFVWKAYAETLWPGLGDTAKDRAASSTALLQRPGRWAAFHATVVGVNHNVVTPHLGKAKAPVLVVMGEKDPDWSEPLKEAEWVASNFTDSEIIPVPGAGHAPMFESPEVVATGVLKFLERIQFGGERV